MTSRPGNRHPLDWTEIDVPAAGPADPRALIGLLALAEDRAVDLSSEAS